MRSLTGSASYASAAALIDCCMNAGAFCSFSAASAASSGRASASCGRGAAGADGT